MEHWAKIGCIYVSEVMFDLRMIVNTKLKIFDQ